MLESRVIRNVNEFNIPSGSQYGFEALYFGANLILMLDYRFSFDVKVLQDEGIQVLILNRKDFARWKDHYAPSNHEANDIRFFYQKKGNRVNDIFVPSVSDSYVFVLDNRYSDKVKNVSLALTHTWKQEVRVQG